MASIKNEALLKQLGAKSSIKKNKRRKSRA